MKENGIKRVLISSYHGFKSDNLKSIMPLNNWIEELVIGSERMSYDGLSDFHNLTLLGVLDNKKDVVDLNNFPNLITLNCSLTKRLTGLENCKKLRNLTVSDYKSKSNDLTAFPVLEKLQSLNLIITSITSLQGIERFSDLKKLEIFRASKLERISSLLTLSESLESLEIEQCKKIMDYEILGRMQSLRKIILSNSGEIKSLSFVQQLPLLDFISFWGTNVLDGNLNYCKKINFVGFDNKRHYTHKVDDFKRP